MFWTVIRENIEEKTRIGKSGNILKRRKWLIILCLLKNLILLQLVEMVNRFGNITIFNRYPTVWRTFSLNMLIVYQVLHRMFCFQGLRMRSYKHNMKDKLFPQIRFCLLYLNTFLKLSVFAFHCFPCNFKYYILYNGVFWILLYVDHNIAQNNSPSNKDELVFSMSVNILYEGQ